MQKTRLAQYRSVLAERLEVAEALARREGRLRASVRDRVLLGEIQAALERIEAGSFGMCARCGRELSERRLAIRPAARHCADCERDER